MSNKEIALSGVAAAAIMSPEGTLTEGAEWIGATTQAAVEGVSDVANNVLNYAGAPAISSSLALTGLAGWGAGMASQWGLNKLNIENGWIRKPVIATSIVAAATSPLAPYFAALTVGKYGYKGGKFALKGLGKGLGKAWDWGKPANNTNYKKEEAA